MIRRILDNMRVLVFSIVGLLLSSCASVRETTVPDVAPETVVEFPVDDVLKQRSIAPITVLDPVYKKQKTYQAVEVTEFFGVLKRRYNRPGTWITFECEDGYAPSIALAELEGAPSFIALGDGIGHPEAFERLPNGQSPGPYYLVWATGKMSPESPWPYQLKKIRIYQGGATHLANWDPGRKLFQSTCLPCHSWLGMGGTVGPDLFFPHRATEYWRRDYLTEFIRNPKTIRLNSKMPTLGLSSSDVHSLLEFIRSAPAR